MEKPIIFSTPMVKAILEGRKTQTRRVIKINGYAITSPEENLELCEEGAIYYSINSMSGYYKPPYQVGDILWVRETWSYSEIYRLEGIKNGMDIWKWRPSIYMPRKAARIFLKVKNVRVERLQDITEEDAIAEGIKGYMEFGGRVKYWIDDLSLGVGDMPRSAKKAFEIIWNSINAKRGYGWDINPWVWVIEFERA